MPLPFRMLWTVVLCLTFSDVARADTIFGKVVDSSNVAVVRARVYVSGVALPVLTDTFGRFAIVVATGTYDIQIVPRGATLVPLEIRAVQVVISKDMGTIKLRAGFAISGRVVTSASAPVVGADINIFDEGNGKLIFTPNDNTDLLGNFIAVVDAGTYRIEVRPAPTVLLVAEARRNVVVAAAKNLGNITMRAGVLVSGTVVDGVTNVPLAGVNIDVEDQFGTNIITPNDRTSAIGTFSIVLPLGLAHMTLEAASTTNYLGLELLNQNITATTNLGVLRMVTGLRLSGRLLGPNAAPVVDADLDIDTAVGDVRVFTPHDNTDATGNYSVVVPPGVYKITYEPRKSTLLVGTRSAAITVSSNTAVPNVTLSPGVLLSGTITAYDNKPEIKADIDVINPTTGAELVTAEDDTDSLGRFSVVVPTGTWNVRFQSAKTSLSRVETVTGVTITAATTLNRKLTLAPVGTYFGTSGIPTITNGSAIPAILAFANPTATIQQTRASIVFRDPLGKETTVVGPLNLAVPVGFSFVTILITPTASISTALLGLQCKLEARFDDPTTGREQDHSRFKFFVK
jgi:hypothetical protein